MLGNWLTALLFQVDRKYKEEKEVLTGIAARKKNERNALLSNGKVALSKTKPKRVLPRKLQFLFLFNQDCNI